MQLPVEQLEGCQNGQATRMCHILSYRVRPPRIAIGTASGPDLQFPGIPQEHNMVAGSEDLCSLGH